MSICIRMILIIQGHLYLYNNNLFGLISTQYCRYYLLINKIKLCKSCQTRVGGRYMIIFLVSIITMSINNVNHFLFLLVNCFLIIKLLSFSIFVLDGINALIIRISKQKYFKICDNPIS